MAFQWATRRDRAWPDTAISGFRSNGETVGSRVSQKDLAGRSKYGQLREAKKSGHYIQRDEPELVTQSDQGRYAGERNSYFKEAWAVIKG
jgi:hypothetical protein